MELVRAAPTTNIHTHTARYETVPSFRGIEYMIFSSFVYA